MDCIGDGSRDSRGRQRLLRVASKSGCGQRGWRRRYDNSGVGGGSKVDAAAAVEAVAEEAAPVGEAVAVAVAAGGKPELCFETNAIY